MSGLISRIASVWHPAAYHGESVSRDFFEGWYLKLVSKDQLHKWAIIPGIFKGKGESSSESFIQVLDGSTGRSWYLAFPSTDFQASSMRFDVSISNSHFGSTGMRLSEAEISGEISFDSDLDPWPITPLSPGVMGWYGLVPFMECFHGVVSFGHQISGTITVEGQEINFDGGRGYIEKDWGKAFPEGYLWLHSNHFDSDPTASFIGSVAIIPWLTGKFRGFIVGLKHSGQLYRWTTYNGAKEVGLEIGDDNANWILSGKDGILELEAKRTRGGMLHAPMRSAMHRRVDESLDAKIKLIHKSKNGEVLFEGTANTSGMEIFGDIEKLLGLKS